MNKSDHIFVGLLLKKENFNDLESLEREFFGNAFHFQDLLRSVSLQEIEDDETYQSIAPEFKELVSFCKTNEELFEFKEVIVDEAMIAIQFNTEEPVDYSTNDVFTWNSQDLANLTSEVLNCQNVCENQMSKELFDRVAPYLGVNFIPNY